MGEKKKKSKCPARICTHPQRISRGQTFKGDLSTHSRLAPRTSAHTTAVPSETASGSGGSEPR